MIRLMFMDERLAHRKERAALRATALTCLLVDQAEHSRLRDRFYALVRDAISLEPNVIPPPPEIHGMNLFPESSDGQRLAFLKGLVSLATDLGFSIYRIGYRGNRDKFMQGNDEREVLPLCFMSIQFCLQEDDPKSVVWPIMELDRGHKKQDQNFSGALQRLDWYAGLIDPMNLTIDNRRLGEVLYHSKQSAYGAAVDCFSYLLHLRFRRNSGEKMSPFKDELADIAGTLNPIIRRDEIIDIKWGEPPIGYVSDGPIRYAYPVTPSDDQPI